MNFKIIGGIVAGIVLAAALRGQTLPQAALDGADRAKVQAAIDAAVAEPLAFAPVVNAALTNLVNEVPFLSRSVSGHVGTLSLNPAGVWTNASLRNVSLAGTVTAADATSTAPSAVANVGTLNDHYDARYRREWIFGAHNLLPTYFGTTLTLQSPQLNSHSIVDIPVVELGTNAVVNTTGTSVGFLEGLSPSTTCIVSRIYYTTRGANFLQNEGEVCTYFLNVANLTGTNAYSTNGQSFFSVNSLSLASNILDAAQATNMHSVTLVFTNTFAARTNADECVGFRLYRSGTTNANRIWLMHTRALP